MDAAVARRMWESFEPVHDVVYFADECRGAADGIGMRGFWMGYVVFRAAPLGAVGPAPVVAAFHGFHPDRVHRALPDAWTYASPEDALRARRLGSAAALRRVWDDDVRDVDETADLAWEAAQATDVAGRVLGAANRDLPRPEDPVEALWQATTTLREHRGDGHVAVLVAANVGPVHAHVLKAAAGESDPTMLRESRRWSERDWTTAADELRERGWLDDGGPTQIGVAARAEIERRTDELATAPWHRLGEARTERLAALLTPLADAVHASGVLPPRNPVGLGRS